VLPIENWLEAVADPTRADAVLDLLIHQALKIALKKSCESKQKRYSVLTDEDNCEKNSKVALL